MANFSFDIVSEIDLQEVDNAINQARKEVLQRYDFKGSKCSIEFDRKTSKITLVGDNEYRLKALTDVLNTKMIKRGVSIRYLEFKTPEAAHDSTLRQTILIKNGIEKEKSKELVKSIKDLKIKVQAQIEGEKVRVSSAKKDELQKVIAHVKGLDFSLPLTFCNYR